MKACSHCGEQFSATCGVAKFCSDACHFGANVIKTDRCWLWRGTRDKYGYGTAKLRGRRVEKAHRLAYRLAQGDVGRGVVICHACDNPICVRPDHLFPGTPLDNKTDCVRKGRHVKGQDLWSSKLTEDDVRAIRADRRPPKDTASHYGVSKEMIRMIQRGLSWKHVE